jgi:hypothetical protein
LKIKATILGRECKKIIVKNFSHNGIFVFMESSDIMHVFSLFIITQIAVFGLFINIAVGLNMDKERKENEAYLKATPTKKRYT